MCGGSVILSGNNIVLLIESAGDNSTFFIFIFSYAFGDFIFLRAQKNEAKKGRPCGGLAQRKSFLESHKEQWPSKSDGQ